MRMAKAFKLLGVVAGACLAIATLSGAVFERMSRDLAAKEFAPVGRLVDIGGRRIQMDCRGTGSPTVVFESGLDIYGSLAWTTVHDSVARTTRACAYSRAGIMWSDPAKHTLNADSIASDLHAALVSSGESAPWVMVGHSLGGSYIAIFTDLYQGEVAGLVMVDASHPDQFMRYEQVVGRSIAPQPFVPKLGAALAWTGLVRALPQPPGPAAWPEAMRFSPPAFLPLSIRGLSAEVSAVPATLDRARLARWLGNRPLVVLCAGNPATSEELATLQLTAAQGAGVHAAHLELCRDMATWSAQGRVEVVSGASHYVQVDRPGAVIGAVREVVGYVIAHDSTPRRR
jgi:pimeloyl-ACP methyl ester carboxylesterase